jgi:hypothetical protein
MVQDPTQQPIFSKSEVDLGTSHNDLLPDNVQQEIQKKLLDAEHHLASLEANIHSVDSTSDDPAHIRHSDLALCIQSYRTAIAPHRKLSNDILLEIFLRCTPSRITARPYLSGSHSEPHNLVRVCSKWRQLVLRTSEFWRDIFVLYSIKEDFERNAVLVRNIILLCGGFPISLSIRVDPREVLGLKASKNPISDFVVEVAGRLRELIWIGNPWILANFYMLQAGSIDSLETVYLELDENSFRSFEGAWPIQVFKDAPKLHTITILPGTDLQYLILPFYLHLPWIQMTHLRFIGYAMQCEDLLLLLYRCPNLSEFRCSTAEDEDHDDNDNDDVVESPTVELPSMIPVHLNLTRLWIEHCEDFGRLFPRLNIPNLASFRLAGKSPSADIWNTIFLSFLARSSSLVHLDITPSVPSNAIHAYLHLLPLLTSFSFRNGEPLLESTLDAMANGQAVPLLTWLECQAVVFDPMLRMLERRSTGVNGGVARVVMPIQTVVALFPYREVLGILESSESERLERLRAKGLRIDFQSC